jgi:protein TonB
MGLLSRAAGVSVLVHLAVVALLLRAQDVPRPRQVAPVEVELRFRAPEARRVVPPSATPAVRNGSQGPRRAVRSSRQAPATTPEDTGVPSAPDLPSIDDGAASGLGSGEPGQRDGAPDGGGVAEAEAARRAVPPAPPTEPAVLGIPRIDYPPRALMDEVEGVVRLDVHLSAEGRVLSIDVLESPSPELAAAARAAVMGARFQPATRDGQPVESRFPYRYRFELR